MRPTNLRPLFSVLIIVCALVAVAGAGLIRRGQGAQFKLPPGAWTFSAVPNSAPEKRFHPAQVVSISSKASKALTIDTVSVLNRGAKDIQAVKLHWSLKEQSQPQTLLEGDTKLIEINIPSGARSAINHAVVSFANIYKPLMRNGVLKGDYTIAVAVNEIRFADGTKWTIADAGSIKFAHASFGPECSNSSCRIDPSTGNYFCGLGSEGTSCKLFPENNCVTELCPIIE